MALAIGMQQRWGFGFGYPVWDLMASRSESIAYPNWQGLSRVSSCTSPSSWGLIRDLGAWTWALWHVRHGLYHTKLQSLATVQIGPLSIPPKFQRDLPHPLKCDPFLRILTRWMTSPPTSLLQLARKAMTGLLFLSFQQRKDYSACACQDLPKRETVSNTTSFFMDDIKNEPLFFLSNGSWDSNQQAPFVGMSEGLRRNCQVPQPAASTDPLKGAPLTQGRWSLEKISGLAWNLPELPAFGALRGPALLSYHPTELPAICSSSQNAGPFPLKYITGSPTGCPSWESDLLDQTPKADLQIISTSHNAIKPWWEIKPAQGVTQGQVSTEGTVNSDVITSGRWLNPQCFVLPTDLYIGL